MFKTSQVIPLADSGIRQPFKNPSEFAFEGREVMWNDPLLILAANACAAVLLVLGKDAANSLFRGETRLVLQNLSLHPQPHGPDAPCVEIRGRRAGLLGFLVGHLDLCPVVLTANSHAVRKTASSLYGHSVECIPLSESVAVKAQTRRSLVWLWAAVLSLSGGAASGLLSGGDIAERLLSAAVWLLAGGAYLAAYYLSQALKLVVHGAICTGVSFRPAVLEGRRISFEQLVEAADILMARIQESRVLGRVGHGPVPAIPASTAAPSQQVPAAPFAPAAEIPAERPDSQQAYAGAGQPPRQRTHGTGTVDYGEEPTGFDSTGWDGGPEPGTSDSILVRQTLSRSESHFLGGPANFEEMDEYEELADPSPSPNAGTHRGTVSWEEHADKTQDEMRAEAELAELKRSRPRRGEAKLRLRELMRRFPQTEAALKARRMLERLESGQ